MLILENEKVFTQDELMNMLDIKSPTTIIKYREMGLGYIRIAGKLYYLEKDLMNFFEKHRVKGK